jgi:hypothetical protein
MMVIIGRCYGVRDDTNKGYKLEGIYLFIFALEVIGIRSWELRVIGIGDYGLCVFVIED